MSLKKFFSVSEIQNHHFRTKMKGYDKDEVKLFLNAVAESYQELLIENTNLKKENERLLANLEEFKQRENLLKEALFIAQKTADEIKANAEKEAKVIVKEAELKGENFVKDAMLRAHLIERQIMDIQLERDNALNTLKNLVSKISSLIETIEKSKSSENVKTITRDKK